MVTVRPFRNCLCKTNVFKVLFNRIKSTHLIYQKLVQPWLRELFTSVSLGKTSSDPIKFIIIFLFQVTFAPITVIIRFTPVFTLNGRFVMKVVLERFTHKDLSASTREMFNDFIITTIVQVKERNCVNIVKILFALWK